MGGWTDKQEYVIGDNRKNNKINTGAMGNNNIWRKEREIEVEEGDWIVPIGQVLGSSWMILMEEPCQCKDEKEYVMGHSWELYLLTLVLIGW